MIKRKGRKYYFEIFNPNHEWKYMGKIIDTNNGKAFCTHFKKPDQHFYIKGQGYPINLQLLNKLKKINIKHIIIPEDGKTGFQTYITPIYEYLNGDTINEPLTEKQKVIKLKQMKKINIKKEKLKKIIYN